MVDVNLTLSVIIIAAVLFPVGIFILAIRYGVRNRAFEALMQAIRWVVAGIWVGVVLYAAETGGSIDAFVAAFIAVGFLTIAEYFILSSEDSAKEHV